MYLAFVTPEKSLSSLNKVPIPVRIGFSAPRQYNSRLKYPNKTSVIQFDTPERSLARSFVHWTAVPFPGFELANETSWCCCDFIAKRHCCCYCCCCNCICIFIVVGSVKKLMKDFLTLYQRSQAKAVDLGVCVCVCDKTSFLFSRDAEILTGQIGWNSWFYGDEINFFFVLLWDR